jgi:lipopolysaccharide/colanic/teichoic acid biosynthesis glycosyltransferase
VLAAYGVGLPDLARNRRSALLSSLAAPAIGAGAISLVQLGTGDALLPRFVVFGSAAALVPWCLACATFARVGRRRDEDRDRVLLVGPDAVATVLAEDLEMLPERPAVLAVSMNVDDAHSAARAQRPVIDSVLRERVSVIVLDHEAQTDESIVAQAALLHENGVRVRTLSTFYEEWLGKLPVSELERVSLLFDIGEVHRARYARLKRLIDVPLAMAGTLILVLAVPFVLVGNLLGNRGPLFYRQERVGMNGRRFNILKFRTMRPADEAVPTEWTSERDPRISSFGALLRRTHLDELPQVWNILRGDLAVVGPRPEQPRYVEELAEKLPFYDLRHLVHPGLTGWAQVKYGYAGDEADALEKLQYEFFYLRHQNLLLDLRTVARTIRSVIGRQGR